MAVLGPTATGKTALGMELALHYGGEIISCDSMQIYRGLSVGTAKPEAWELKKVPHHLVDFQEVTESFSVSDYVIQAGEVIHRLYAAGKLPVLVGGTGLYARSLLHGVVFSENGRDDRLREQLEQEAERDGVAVLYERLTALDPEGAALIHVNNQKRVIRALEYCVATGMPFSAQAQQSRRVDSEYTAVVICLGCRNRQTLYDRIDRRVDRMLEQGLLQEAEVFYRVCQSAGKPLTAAQAIGYKELFQYLEGKASLEEAVERLKMESRRYAKRQITWFKREENAFWLYVDDYDNQEQLTQAAVTLVDRQSIGEGGKCIEQ